MSEPAVPAPPERERTMWRVLVGLQVAAVAMVVIAIVVVWLIGRFGSEFGSR